MNAPLGNFKRQHSVKLNTIDRVGLIFILLISLSRCAALDPLPAACLTDSRVYGTFDNTQLLSELTSCEDVDVDQCKPAFQRINNIEISKVFVESENCGDLGY